MISSLIDHLHSIVDGIDEVDIGIGVDRDPQRTVEQPEYDEMISPSPPVVIPARLEMIWVEAVTLRIRLL